MERADWILVAAKMPDHMPALRALKRGQSKTGGYGDLPRPRLGRRPGRDDPRLPAIADRLVEMIDKNSEQWSEDQFADFAFDGELIALLDEVFVNAVPADGVAHTPNPSWAHDEQASGECSDGATLRAARPGAPSILPLHPVTDRPGGASVGDRVAIPQIPLWARPRWPTIHYTKKNSRHPEDGQGKRLRLQINRSEGDP